MAGQHPQRARGVAGASLKRLHPSDRLLPRGTPAVKALRDRTLTRLYNTRGTPEGAWLDRLHAALDASVAAAYGWPADLPDAEVLSRLLALNHARG